MLFQYNEGFYWLGLIFLGILWIIFFTNVLYSVFFYNQSIREAALLILNYLIMRFLIFFIMKTKLGLNL